MLFELNKFNSSHPLQKLINLTNDDRQKQFIKALYKGCQNSDTVIYYLSIDNDICGMIGLSASRVDNIPCLHIDYLFVKEEYRKNIYENLNNKKISEYLISLAISLATEIKEKMGLRWLVLNPDNSELEKFYIDSFKFTKYKTSKDKLIYLFIAL